MDARLQRLLLAGLVAGACAPAEPPPRPSALSVTDTLAAGSIEGFERALAPRPFTFPDDHGPHPRFRTEWWYVTGRLRDPDGRLFGYQVTIFRNALRPDAPASTSAWATNEVWMAHLAVTDVADGILHAFERFERGAVGLAGASADPPRAWVGPWEIAGDDDGSFPTRVRARQGPLELDLELTRTRPFVLHGERGLSRKGAEPGNASYYYSATRLATRGRLSIDGEEHEVTGSSWLDREWSTSVLEEGQIGWDWFALEFHDGRDLMVYRLRTEDGSDSPRRAGTLVAADDSTRHLDVDDFTLEPLATWTSPSSGVTYPVRWRLRVPSADLDLEVEAALDDQELDLAFRYWEGVVRVTGEDNVTGTGYVELVGYDGREPRLRR